MQKCKLYTKKKLKKAKVQTADTVHFYMRRIKRLNVVKVGTIVYFFCGHSNRTFDTSKHCLRSVVLRHPPQHICNSLSKPVALIIALTQSLLQLHPPFLQLSLQPSNLHLDPVIFFFSLPFLCHSWTGGRKR